MFRFTFVLFFTINLSFSQSYIIFGTVIDDQNQFLESANIIAKPLQEKATLKFAIADNKGRYKLELDANVKYEITVSYIGYTEEILIVEPNSTITSYNFSELSIFRGGLISALNFKKYKK